MGQVGDVGDAVRTVDPQARPSQSEGLPAEPAGGDVVHDRAADIAWATADAQHGHRLRLEHGCERPTLGLSQAGIRGNDGFHRCGEFHRQGDDAVVALFGQMEAGVMEDAQHRTVLGKDLRVEPGQPQAATPVREVPQQRRRDPEAVQRVVDEERHLGSRRSDANRCGVPYQQPSTLGDERPRRLVRTDHASHVGRQRSPAQREEPPVQAVITRTLVQGKHLSRISFGRRANDGARPVCKQRIGAGELRAFGRCRCN